MNSVSFQNPDDYASQYAAKNNISVDAAKEQLKAKYGDPVRPNGNDSASIFGVRGNNQQIQNINPDDFAQVYADMNGISLDEAKSTLKSSYGEPTKPETSETSTASKPDPGIDPDEFAQTYADEHGISLDEAKTKLSELYGIPTQPEQNNNNNVNFFKNIFGLFRLN